MESAHQITLESTKFMHEVSGVLVLNKNQPIFLPTYSMNPIVRTHMKTASMSRCLLYIYIYRRNNYSNKDLPSIFDASPSMTQNAKQHNKYGCRNLHIQCPKYGEKANLITKSASREPPKNYKGVRDDYCVINETNDGVWKSSKILQQNVKPINGSSRNPSRRTSKTVSFGNLKRWIMKPCF